MNETIKYLKKCDHQYFNGLPLEMDDKQYDILRSQARKNYPDDEYWGAIGAPVLGSAVKLPHILGSLKKMKMDGSLNHWCRDNDIKKISISDKLDGVSVYVRYEDGFLVQASTRGDGYEGKDITVKVKLRHPRCGGTGVIELRGEAVMTVQNCEKLGYSLPRSAVAGILNGDDKEHFDKMEFVDFVFYTPLGLQDIPAWPYMFYKIGDTGLECVKFSSMAVTDDIERDLSSYFATRKKCSEWDIDGIVVADYDDTTVGEDYYPSNIVAFKVNEDATECTVTDVKWEVKRSGKIQPVVWFEPVKINGSTVQKATGFNKKFIVDNHIHQGSKIGIVKSGDIIPYIVDCYTREDGVDIDIPTDCPSCGEWLGDSISGVDIRCTNMECPGINLFAIEHFLLSLEAEEITATTIKRLGVSSIQELYTLSEFDISTIEGMGMKRAQTIVSQIQNTLNTTPEKLLKSFGISGIGNSASDLILNTFGDLDTVFTRNLNDFLDLDGIGGVLARNLFDGLRANVELYVFLKKQGLKFEEKASADLQGKIFTLTGKSDLNRNDLSKMIASHGGMVKGISKKVSYLVTNDVDSQSTKMKKARQYGIEIISYDDLLNIIS